ASLATRLWRHQKTAFQKRREAAAPAKLEKAAFVAQLEADEGELAQTERDALEAGGGGEAAPRLPQEGEQAGAADLSAPEASREPAWVATLSTKDLAERSAGKPLERKLPQIVTPPPPPSPAAVVDQLESPRPDELLDVAAEKTLVSPAGVARTP